MGKTLLLLAAPLLTTFAPVSLTRYPRLPEKPVLWAEPVPLREDAPDARGLGALRFIEGWWLRSDHPHFGGISAIDVADGKILAVSDGGVVMRFALPTGRGRMPLDITTLADAPGPEKKQRDSEAMAVDGGTAWIAFERTNAVYRYRMSDWRSDASSRPQPMRRWPLNSGSEAMIRLRDGRFLIFSEGARLAGGDKEVLLFNGDPAVDGTPFARLGYRPPEGFRITDAAQLPDGRLLLLNRRISLFDGIMVKLNVVDRPDFREGAVLEARELAFFQAPVTTDNYEALSIVQENAGATLWIASDDNLMGIQRTLLMKFALED